MGTSSAADPPDPTIDDGNCDRILGQHRQPRVRLVALGYLLIAGVQFVFIRYSGGYGAATMFAIGGAFGLVAPPTEVTPTGVRLPTIRPWRRPVPFTDVTAVLKPSALSRGRWLRLQLRGGEVVTLRYVASERAAAVAQLAGVEVRVERYLPMPQPPKPYVGPVIEDSDRPLSETELARRFADLQQRAAQLSAQLRRPTEKG